MSIDHAVSIDDVIRVHADLMKEISKLTKEVIMLRGESGIAREAVDRFCPPGLRDTAEKWLRAKGF